MIKCVFVSDESAECVVCDAAVRRLQQGLQCDTCNRWQHRTCNSGITQEEYRRLRYEDNFEWHCVNCSGQQTNEPQDTSEDTYQIGDAVVDEATFHVTLDSVTSTGGGASNTDRCSRRYAVFCLTWRLRASSWTSNVPHGLQ